VTAGAGFLLAVLWFDLMFDVQAARHAGPLPDDALTSITGYYRRVTTDARPMNRLVAAAMLATLAALAIEIGRGAGSAWMRIASVPLALAPVGLAAARTVPRAVRLGARTGTTDEQSALARSILRDHVFCFAAIAALVTVQLVGR